MVVKFCEISRVCEQSLITLAYLRRKGLCNLHLAGKIVLTFLPTQCMLSFSEQPRQLLMFKSKSIVNLCLFQFIYLKYRLSLRQNISLSCSFVME